MGRLSSASPGRVARKTSGLYGAEEKLEAVCALAGSASKQSMRCAVLQETRAHSPAARIRNDMELEVEPRRLRGSGVQGHTRDDVFTHGGKSSNPAGLGVSCTVSCGCGIRAAGLPGFS